MERIDHNVTLVFPYSNRKISKHLQEMLPVYITVNLHEIKTAQHILQHLVHVDVP